MLLVNFSKNWLHRHELLMGIIGVDVYVHQCKRKWLQVWRDGLAAKLTDIGWTVHDVGSVDRSIAVPYDFDRIGVVNEYALLKIPRGFSGDHVALSWADCRCVGSSVLIDVRQKLRDYGLVFFSQFLNGQDVKAASDVD